MGGLHQTVIISSEANGGYFKVDESSIVCLVVSYFDVDV